MPVKGGPGARELSGVPVVETGNKRYKLYKKDRHHADDLIFPGGSRKSRGRPSEVNLQHLITPRKFIPVYLSRILSDPSGLSPHSVELHLTSTCNYNCSHCSYSLRNKKNVFIKSAVVGSLVAELSKDVVPRGVYFSGGGEPTTLKNWHKYIAALDDSGIDIALITNGSLIKKEHLPAVSLLQYMAVSIYSVNEDIYRKITGGNKFDISFVLPGQIKKKAENIVVGARCVINEFNYGEIVQIYHKSLDVGYDYIIFIPEVDYEKRGVALTEKMIGKLLEITSHGGFDDKKTNINGLRANKFHYYSDYRDISAFDCQAIRLRTNAFINYDGGVYLCQPHIGNEEYCIGNLNSQKLAKIWNGKRHLAVIEKLSLEYKNNRCANCRSIACNKAVAGYLNLPNNTPVDIVKDSFL